NGSFTRNNIFSFSDTAPFAITSWNPNVNGTVNTIAFSGGNCSTAYIGGQFTTVGGATAHNLAAVSTTTGALVPGFKDNVGGQQRRQIFMINVSGSSAALTGWTSPEFDGSDPSASLNANDKYFNCGDSHPFYIHAAAWSPDDSEIYLADTGVKPILWNGTFPMVGLCDAAAAFPATQTQVFSDWLAYDGCY